MRFRLPAWAIALTLAALFLAVNARAVDGYFSDDDLDNLAWNSFVGLGEYGRGLIDVKLSPHNFRPVAHFYFFAMERMAGESFPAYVVVMQTIHLLNAALIGFLSRRLGASTASAFAAAGFFAFSICLFDAVWKPMYIFDALCATFCLLTVMAWIARRWLVAAVCFWLAYKSKEIALFLPAAIAMYEFTRGGQRWRQLIPMFAIAASFGLQALLAPKGPATDYSLRFTPDALAKTLPFYASQLGWAAALGIAGAARGPWLAGGLLMMVPLLFLPGRLFAVYWCVPLAMVCLSLRFHRRWQAALLLIWAGATLVQIPKRQREELAWAAEARTFYPQVAAAARTHRDVRTIIYDGAPAGTHPWGVAGMIHWQSRNPAIEVRYAESPPAPSPGEVVLHWDHAKRVLSLSRGNDPL
jgi:hypothetical protein